MKTVVARIAQLSVALLALSFSCDKSTDPKEEPDNALCDGVAPIAIVRTSPAAVNYGVGDTVAVALCTEIAGNAHTIEFQLSADSGATWVAVSAAAVSGDSLFAWTPACSTAAGGTTVALIGNRCFLRASVVTAGTDRSYDTTTRFSVRETGADYVCQCATGTDSDHHLKLVQPNGSEALTVGQLVDIVVCTSDAEPEWVSTCVLEISVDNGKNWAGINPLSLGIPQSRKWMVPSTVNGPDGDISLVGAQIIMRVSAYDQLADPTVDYDLSDGAFTVAN